MSKETLSIKTLSEIIPLYNSVCDTCDKCMKELCSDCNFKSFGKNCQSMRVAVKLQNTVHNIVKTELTKFCDDFISALSETDETMYKYDFIIFIMDSVLKKCLEENNKNDLSKMWL